MIVDSHHHLWDPARRDYPWMTGPAAVLRIPRRLADLRAETSASGVSRTVVVQAVSDLDETTELLAVAESSDDLIGGVVGWVDLTAPDVGDQLDRLAGGPGGDRLAGVRHQVHDEHDPDWLARPDVLRGLAALAERDLVYDLLVRTRELPAALRAVRAIDGLSFVVDHCAKPEIAAGVVEPWAERIAVLAEAPNVACKLSGLVTEAGWHTWTVDDLRPYVDLMVELFGPDRLLFGSDWPVCTLAASYGDVLGAARECLADLSPAERAGVLGDNATRIYRL